MPALLLRILLQCASDIEMNPEPVSTPTLTNCLLLMQWNANRISEKITELLTFLHSNNVNITAIQETKLTNKTMPFKTSGWAAVRLDRHKNKGGGLLVLIKETIPFVDSTAALPQSYSILIWSNNDRAAALRRSRRHQHAAVLCPIPVSVHQCPICGRQCFLTQWPPQPQ